MYPKPLKELIENLQKLPSIGKKSAERLSLFIASSLDSEDVTKLTNSLLKVKSDLKFCKTCHLLTDQDECEICQNEDRNNKKLMIVSDSKDVFIIENAKTYYGKYHVLGGLIDFSRGIGIEELNFSNLKNRIDENIEEVIIATNGTVEGELTAQIIKQYLKDYDKINLTRIGYGLPVGTDLKYVDEQTILKSLENRKKY